MFSNYSNFQNWSKLNSGHFPSLPLLASHLLLKVKCEQSDEQQTVLKVVFQLVKMSKIQQTTKYTPLPMYFVNMFMYGWIQIQFLNIFSRVQLRYYPLRSIILVKKSWERMKPGPGSPMETLHAWSLINQTQYTFFSHLKQISVVKILFKWQN